MSIREQYKRAYAIAKKCTNTNASFAIYDHRTAQAKIDVDASDNAWLSMCHRLDYDSCGKRYRMIVADRRFMYYGGSKAWREFCTWFYTKKV